MKYSIIIPVQNSIKTLSSTIKSVISQNYSDYELIISDDHSEDGTSEYLDTINDSHIKIVHTDKELLINEHFMFAQGFATGDWQMFLGGDDFLQPYFFELADKLVTIAERNNINAICSERAYYYWNGLTEVYGNVQSSYYPKNIINIKSCKKAINNIMFDNDCYFNYPQMYTTSIFSKNLINKIKAKQKGKFIILPISDASMAAASLFYTKKYIYCGIPLGVVGTSPKSVFRTVKDKNKLKLPEIYGAYELGSTSNYFRAALTEIGLANSNKKYIKKMFLLKYFSLNYSELNCKHELFTKMVDQNHISNQLVYLYSKFYNYEKKIIGILKKILNKVLFIIGKKSSVENNNNDMYIYTTYDNPLSLKELRDNVIQIYNKCLEILKIKI